jgi:hypothetical protein
VNRPNEERSWWVKRASSVVVVGDEAHTQAQVRHNGAALDKR